MKKSILIVSAVIATCGVGVFAFMGNGPKSTNLDIEEQKCQIECVEDKADVQYPVPETDLFYHVGTRWNPKTKSELLQIKKIEDLTNQDALIKRSNYRNTRVSVLHNPKDVRDIKTEALGNGDDLNFDQLELIKSLDYSKNLRVTALANRYDTRSGEKGQDSLVFYMTVTPEQVASYDSGQEALIAYLKEACYPFTKKLKQKDMEAGQIAFIVSKNGEIKNVRLNQTCGFDKIDPEFVKVVKNMPSKWTPAKNAKGENVDQELVFSFGQGGC